MTNLNNRPPSSGLPTSPEDSSPDRNPPHLEPPFIDGAMVKRFLQRILAGNPFYLISAATMLYGLYLVATDPQMIQEELSKLWFNVSSLEIYELMFVGTALLLARRRIWYDCNLLVTLENMFMFVPFILISQATLFDDGTELAQTRAMIDDRNIWMVCAIACGFALVKLIGLRQVSILKLPASLIAFGLSLTILNIFLPLYYRNLIDLVAPVWEHASAIAWFILFPGCVLVANLLPNLRAPDEPALSRRNWPLVMPLLWIVATAVHLRSIDYLDNIPFSTHHTAPLIWAMAWTFFFRTSDFTKAPSAQLRMALLILPIPVSFAAVTHADSNLFLTLMAGNALLSLRLFLTDQFREQARHLVLISIVACVAALPVNWADIAVPNFSREKIIILCNAAYLILLLGWRRLPVSSLFAAVVFGSFTAYYIEFLDYLGPYAVQNGLLFVLIHSLFWKMNAPRGQAVRTAAASGLIAHSFIWCAIVNFKDTDIHVGLTIMLAGLLVLAAWLIAARLRGEYGSKIIPWAASLTIATVPANYAIDVLRVAPSGHLTILVSFLLFAIGTAFALTRDRWMETGAHLELGHKTRNPVP